MTIYENITNITEPVADTGQLYIYVLENYPQGNIKIGRTTNPQQRMRSLSGSNSGGNYIKRVAISPMTYLYTIEETCHTHYHRNRVKGTEYFKDITFEEVVSYIEELFNSPSYERCNRIRKEFYECNHNNIPTFLKRDE